MHIYIDKMTKVELDVKDVREAIKEYLEKRGHPCNKIEFLEDFVCAVPHGNFNDMEEDLAVFVTTAVERQKD